LTAVEFSSTDKNYAWERIEAADGFHGITLFHAADIDDIPVGRLLPRIGDVLGRIRPDVVAIPGWSNKAALLALGWALSAGTPAVIMSESNLQDGFRTAWKEAGKKRVVKFFSSGFVGGRSSSEYLAALGMSPDRIFTGYDVVDNDYFADRSQIERQNAQQNRVQLGLPERFFLASNRFIKKKNLFRLLHAYSQYVKCTKNSWKLVLLGDGPLMPDIVELRSNLGLEQDVVLPGFKQYGDLPGYYALASAFIHASTVEPWGLVVNEAMASGLPVLVSRNCGCAADLVEEGRNGFTFDPYDIDKSAKLMGKIASDECDRESMGQASQEIIARWTPLTFAQNLLKAAEAALDAPRPGACLFDRFLLRALIHR
jgi:glycosyltransferase involved in cell wall biosynthesis